MSSLKITVITVCRNSEKTLLNSIESVLSQSYPDIEYIIVDGLSTDGTAELVSSFGSKIAKFISEPDSGMYDAINKGIRIASGEIIGILNSDDFFYDKDVLARVAKAFERNEIDAVYGDVKFVDPNNISKIVRNYSSKHFNPQKFKFGFMPAHPSFYAKRELFEKLGYYKTDYKIGADFDLLIRFIYSYNIRCKYLEIPFVYMRTGGISTQSFRSNILLNREIKRACKENGIHTNYFNIYSKYFIKMFEYFN
jgi:glycosyltransferase involved in cell wall biosynthesis